MNEDDVFGLMVIWFGSMIILGLFMINFTKITTEEIGRAEGVCKISGSYVKHVYADGDFRCTNGAEFDSGVAK
jgi:hypothetical protein